MRTMPALLLLWLFVSPSGAGAQSVLSSAFDKAFNAASARVGTQLTLTKVGCKPATPSDCEFGAVPDLRVVTTGAGDGRVDTVAAYLPRDGADRARSQRSAVMATTVMATLIGVFNPSVSAKRRGEVVSTLLDGATGATRRGEIDLGGVNYVLSATQADNLRIYVTR